MLHSKGKIQASEAHSNECTEKAPTLTILLIIKLSKIKSNRYRFDLAKYRFHFLNQLSLQ